MPLILQAIPSFGFVIPVIDPVEGIIQKGIRVRLTEALAIIDFVGPGVGKRRLESSRKAFVDLNDQGIV